MTSANVVNMKGSEQGSVVAEAVHLNRAPEIISGTVQDIAGIMERISTNDISTGPTTGTNDNRGISSQEGLVPAKIMNILVARGIDAT